MFERHDKINDKLYVIAPIYNPRRFRSRWKLYEDFARMVEKSGAVLYTGEVAFGDRDFVITQPNNPQNLQLRTTNELWLKENIINLIVQRLPLDWKYVAWVDADVTFARSDWANETLHQLQHYKMVQMWSQAQDLSPTYEILKTFRSFVWCWQHGISPNVYGDYYYDHQKGIFHPGFAWACTRDTYNALGGLIDWAILGGADLYMARALTGIDKTLPKSLGESGKKWLKLWQDRASEYINGNVGLVDGLLLHHFHGKKHDRKYKDRGQILVDANFEPESDLKRDWQGLYQLTYKKPLLRDGLKTYFQNRNEDSIDV